MTREMEMGRLMERESGGDGDRDMEIERREKKESMVQ